MVQTERCLKGSKLDGLQIDNPNFLYASLIFVSFLFSVYFAAVETALTALSRVQIERIISRGGFFDRSLEAWQDHPNRLLATILVADTLADTALVTLTTSYVIQFYPGVHIAIITALLTIFVLFFGEIAPKTIARGYAEPLAPYFCRILSVIDFILYPITQGISDILSKALKTVGLNLPTTQGILSRDIESMVEIATREGSVEKGQTEILSSVFEFSKRRVKDIMIPRDRICALAITSTLPQVLDVIRQNNHSRYPVYDRTLDRMMGFLHARDVFAVIHNANTSIDPQGALDNFSLRTCLRRAFFVSESMMISRVLHDMKSNRIHLAIVKDEWGNVVGLVTLEDILEEVVGDIEDEHDEAVVKPVVDLYGAGVEVDGTETLVDLQSRYGVEIEPSESYSTLNGFLQHYASHQQLTPKMIIIWNKYVFSILSVKDGKVERVRITEIPSDESE